jgi:hypothetical protein
MELEITWSRVLRIWWSYLWRNLIAILVTVLIAGVLGFIIGFIMGAMGITVSVIKLVTAPIGFAIGLVISVVPMKLILGKDFGEFQLVLLANQPSAATATTSPPVTQ